MNKRINLWMLGITAMLASCSQNELTDTGTDREATAVFTVSMDGQINTRAAVTDPTDGTATRCLMEVYNADGTLQGKQYVGTASNGTFTFTTDRLDKEQEYTFVFWADEGEDAYTATNLTTVTPGTTPGIAFSGKVELTPDGTNTDVTLTHAVAKLVLNQSMPLTVGDEAGILFSVPRYAYNALTEKYEAVENEEAADLGNDAIEITTGNQSGMLFSAYALVPGSAEAEQVNVILSYLKQGTQLGTKTLAVPNVPLKRNFRTVITGDLAQLYTGVNQVFKAVINEQWADDQPQNIKPNVVTSGSIKVNVAGTLTAEEVAKALEGTSGALAITGTIGEKDFHLLATYTGTVSLTSLDLSGTTGLKSVSNPKDSKDVKTFTTLQAIKLPESCKTIRKYTFQNSAIVTLDGGGVETMYDYAANICTALATINLPCAKDIRNNFVNYSMGDRDDAGTCTLKLTAAGNITLGNPWNYHIHSNSTLYLNPDKKPDSDSGATPKVGADGKTWGGQTFKEIIYADPSSLTTE